MELKNIKKEISTQNVANKDKKKQCHVDTARNKSPAKTGMEQAGLGKGKLFHTDSNDDWENQKL